MATEAKATPSTSNSGKTNSITRDAALQLLTTYGRAWETRDPELILTVFTPDATYNDPKEPLNHGHAGIRAYWISKVIGEQRDIKFTLLHYWIDGENVIAEWHASFVDVPRHVNISMTEVAIFGVRDGLFSSLREYYKAIKTPITTTSAATTTTAPTAAAPAPTASTNPST